ncbi:MAG: hypothetical protein E6R13_07625 [Spirochaetes bacterium]|nr:MAG: hypothetical protein E6R13_07625 [Spirochaetota bacterium]
MAIKFLSNLKIGNITFPTQDGAAGQVLATDGAGNLSFVNAATVDKYINGLSFSGGTLTASVAGGSNVSVSLDGRYALTSHNHAGVYDNYQSWNLKTNGVQRTTVQSGGTLDLVAGSNVSLSYSAGGVVTIAASSTETDTLATVTARGASTSTPVTFNGNVTLGNSADLIFSDLAGTFPTSGKGFDWTLNNDGARIYAIQPSSDSIDLVFQLRDNATTNDRFVFWVKEWQGAAFDKYPLIISGGTQFDLKDSALYTNSVLRLSNTGVLQNVTGNISMFTNDSGYITGSGSTSGNAGTATRLATARTLTIGNTGKSFDGSANVAWSLSEIGAQPAGSYAASSHTHDDRYYTEGEVGNFFSGATAITGYNKSNWDTAFGWGNHASAGYALANGTVNYIPKFTASGTIGNSLIYDNGTYIGIGTNTPTATLEVSSSNYTGIAISRSIQNAGVYIQAKGYDTGNIYRVSSQITFDQVSDTFWVNGGISFATASSGSLVTRWKILTDGTFQSNGAGKIETSSSNLTLNAPFGDIYLMPQSTKNVGIGTISPSEKLDVNGNIKATSFIKSGGTSTQFLMADGSVNSNTYVKTDGTNASGTWGISITGNAATATTLQTARAINGTAFNGSADITTAKWGTARTITIGNTGKSVNGSANVSWTLAEIGAYAATNPNGYTSNTGTVTSVSGTGSYGGLTLSGTVTGSGSLTLGGTPSGTWPISITGNASTASSTTVVGVHAGNEVNLGGGYTGGGTLYVNYNDGGSYTNMSFYNGGTSLCQLTASQFNGALSGNATTATTLQTARTINGTSFNGSANITTANWGTGRTITIGSTGKTVDGSGNVSWSLAEIGAQVAGSYAAASHTHDDRYLPYSASSEYSNLPAGWYTIAVNAGNRASGKFILRDTSSGNHQSTVFYATHHYGSYSDITVLINSRYSGNPFRYLRIKDGGTYDGAMLQVYLDQGSNTVTTWLLENIQANGWIVKNWIAD